MYRVEMKTIITKQKTRTILSQIEEAAGIIALTFVAFVIAFVDFIWDLAATLSLILIVVADCLRVSWRMRDADFRPLIDTSPLGCILISPAPSLNSIWSRVKQEAIDSFFSILVMEWTLKSV